MHILGINCILCSANYVLILAICLAINNLNLCISKKEKDADSFIELLHYPINKTLKLNHSNNHLLLEFTTFKQCITQLLLLDINKILLKKAQHMQIDSNSF